MKSVRALVQTWLVLDFFGDSRRSGGTSSSLTTTIFTQSFLAFVFAAILYPETPPVPFAAANLCLSSLLVAVGALGDHDQWNRRRADQVLLATSPVRRLHVVVARSGHAAFYVALVTIGMALPPAILLAFLLRDATAALGYVVLACACSGLATGALAVLVRAFERILGHDRAALLAGTTKALLLGFGLVLFALGMQQLQQTAEALPIGRLGAELLPPYHAARLLAAPVLEAWRVLPFVGGAFALLLLGVALGQTEPDQLASRSRGGVLSRLLRRLAGRGPCLGIAEFVAVSMWRSPGFRARVLPLLGLPAGMVFLSLPSGGRRDAFVFTCLLLQLPAIYLPFLIAFLPRADQTGTGWVFDQAPTLSLDLLRDATWRALVTHVLLPVHALAWALLCLSTASPLDSTAASLFAFGLAVVASRAMLRTLDTVPFTLDSDADTATDLGALFTSALVLGGLGTVFGGVLPAALRWPAALGVCIAAGFWLAKRPRTGAEPLPLPLPLAAGDPASLALRATQVPAEREDPTDGPARPEASLRGELRAIVVLYAAVCVLPALVGAMFGA